MKPGDHPDFYRFPPPPGRSRESKIVLDAQGQFWNDGVRFEHPGMIRAFASWIRRHPDDGRYILSNGYDWTYLEVEDVPCFVRSMELRDGALWLTLLDGSEQPMAPDALRIGPGDALYVELPSGLLAKWLPSAQSALVSVIGEDAEGRPVVELGGRTYPIGHLEP